MIPVGAIVGAILLASRLSQQERRKETEIDGLRLLHLAWYMAAWLFPGMAIIVLLAQSVVALFEQPVVAIPLALAALPLVPFVCPWQLARLFIWSRMPRLAFHAARLSLLPWHLDGNGGAVLAGAIALARRRRLDERRAAWLEDRLARPRLREAPLRGAGILAAGLVAAARGDRAAARELVRSSLEIDRRALPRRAAAMAREWLAAEAASRGDWHEVVWIGAERGPRSRGCLLLALCARRLTGEPVRPVLLRLAWAIAPRRRRTRPLLRLALAAVTTPRRIAEEAAPLQVGGDVAPLLATAIRRHAFELDPGSPASFARVVEAWDAALDDPAIHARIVERAAALRATDASRALPALRAIVEQDLAAAGREAPASLDALGGSGTGQRVAARLRDELCAEVDLALDALQERLRDKRALAPLDEWREWRHLRQLHERAAASGGTQRRLVFPRFHQIVTSHAVWLFNERGERAIGNAMLRHLLDEARALQDAAAIELQTKNVAIGV